MWIPHTFPRCNHIPKLVIGGTFRAFSYPYHHLEHSHPPNQTAYSAPPKKKISNKPKNHPPNLSALIIIFIFFYFFSLCYTTHPRPRATVHEQTKTNFTLSLSPDPLSFPSQARDRSSTNWRRSSPTRGREEQMAPIDINFDRSAPHPVDVHRCRLKPSIAD